MTELSLLSYNCPNVQQCTTTQRTSINTLLFLRFSPRTTADGGYLSRLVAKFILTQKNAGSRLKEECRRWFYQRN